MKKLGLYLGLFILCIVAVSCRHADNSNAKSNINLIEKKVEIVEPEEKEITVMAMGDILCHDTQYIYAYDKETKTYDFSHQFKYLKEYFKRADLVVANYEGTSSPDYPLGGYPLFNAPKENIEILKKDGFDVLATCNNHSLDSRKSGVISTIERIEAAGLDHFGTRKSKEDSRIFIKDVQGIKVGFLGYSYGFNGMEANLSDEDLDAMVNYFDEAKIKKDIENTRKAGADFIIIYPHWGEEYATEENDSQRALAKKMFEWGADAILGSHVHVLQGAEMMEVNGEKKFIIYSMGNLVHDQYPSAVGGAPVDIGTMIEFKILKSGDKSKIKDIKIVPLYVNRVRSPKIYWEVIPMDELMEKGSLKDKYSDEFKAMVSKKREWALKTIGFKGEN